MKCLRIINILIFCLTCIGCSKQIEYQMMVTSAQSRRVTVTYPDGYWGDIESLQITHKENSGTEVDFHPKSIEVNGVTTKCIGFDVPRPNQNELEWSDDKLSANGHSTLRFKSDNQDITLRFEFSLHFSENKEILGGSSMQVSSVIYNGKKIDRDDHIYNYSFCFGIEQLM